MSWTPELLGWSYHVSHWKGNWAEVMHECGMQLESHGFGSCCCHLVATDSYWPLWFLFQHSILNRWILLIVTYCLQTIETFIIFTDFSLWRRLPQHVKLPSNTSGKFLMKFDQINSFHFKHLFAQYIALLFRSLLAVSLFCGVWRCIQIVEKSM